MKRLASWAFISLLTIASTGCSDGGKLTSHRAEQAVTQWIIIRTTGTAVVTGVLEFPQENAAKADVTFTNLQWNSPKNGAVLAMVVGPGGESHLYSGHADAIFIHYNDGRWILDKIVAPMGTWENLNIVADGLVSCKVLVPHSDYQVVVSPYDGECKDGLANGNGTYTMLSNQDTVKVVGEFHGGKLNDKFTMSGAGFEIKGEMRDNVSQESITRYFDGSGNVTAGVRRLHGSVLEVCKRDRQGEVKCNERDVLLGTH